ncbi:MAG: DsbC family protein [Zoogloeaceae bacterium]|jgi:thiol:disulfide interchange protein DsbC|nr:DsbC family protein [Zoogloeaceae bacterium]
MAHPRFQRTFPFFLAFFLALPAAAQQEDKIKKAVESKLNIQVTSVTKTGYLGLYEVYFDGRILYTDEKISAFLDGNLVDGNTLKSVTATRMDVLTRVRFSDLPVKQAIRQVRGNGKRVLATFEDPNCGYCKHLNRELARLDNVTIYTFLYPILGEDSLVKSRQIWCARDQAKAWSNWMAHGKAPGGAGNCDISALVRNQAYGRKSGITAVPTLFFSDGVRASGALPLADIEKKMNSLL